MEGPERNPGPHRYTGTVSNCNQEAVVIAAAVLLGVLFSKTENCALLARNCPPPNHLKLISIQYT